MTKRNGIIAAAVAILILIFAGWYYGSPRWSLRQMRSAAEAGDVDRLATYIDFPALRVSMKEEVKAQLTMHMKDAKGFEALGAMMAMSMVDGMVDGMVTPATMRKAFVKDKTKGPEGFTKVDGARPDLAIERIDFSTFRLADAKDKAAGMIFRRDGLGWKLSAVRLPAD